MRDCPHPKMEEDEKKPCTPEHIETQFTEPDDPVKVKKEIPEKPPKPKGTSYKDYWKKMDAATSVVIPPKSDSKPDT